MHRFPTTGPCTPRTRSGDDTQPQLGVPAVAVERPSDRRPEVVELLAQVHSGVELVGTSKVAVRCLLRARRRRLHVGDARRRARPTRLAARAHRPAGSRATGTSWSRFVRSSATTIDFATSSPIASTMSHRSTPAPVATSPAASMSNPPAKTPRRSNTKRLAIAEQRVRPLDRGAQRLVPLDRVRCPPVSRRNRSSSKDAISAGRIAATRAAASSIANGIPSRRRQISATASRFCVSSSNDGRARARGRRTA